MNKGMRMGEIFYDDYMFQIIEWEREVGNFFSSEERMIQMIKFFHGTLFFDYIFCLVWIVGTGIFSSEDHMIQMIKFFTVFCLCD